MYSRNLFYFVIAFFARQWQQTMPNEMRDEQAKFPWEIRTPKVRCVSWWGSVLDSSIGFEIITVKRAGPG